MHHQKRLLNLVVKYFQNQRNHQIQNVFELNYFFEWSSQMKMKYLFEEIWVVVNQKPYQNH